jgi:SAM-dependent methyltransferase
MYMTAAGFLPNISGKRVLHFAPEKRLSRKISAASPSHYVKCDLFPMSKGVMKANLLNIPFHDGSFDLLIANHVMEHVSDDGRALREIVRVLKPGGFAILQTPFSAKLHNTWEDAGIDSDEARLEAYGQEDHVRLYGQDVFLRFTSFGLISCVRSHEDLLPEVDASLYGVNDREPFFLFQKPKPSNEADSVICTASSTQTR